MIMKITISATSSRPPSSRSSAASSTAAAWSSAINAKGFAGITTGQMNRLNEIAIQAGCR
jgi:exo-beta-1,3-glucanase (GH17 family)